MYVIAQILQLERVRRERPDGTGDASLPHHVAGAMSFKQHPRDGREIWLEGEGNGVAVERKICVTGKAYNRDESSPNSCLRRSHPRSPRVRRRQELRNSRSEKRVVLRMHVRSWMENELGVYWSCLSHTRIYLFSGERGFKHAKMPRWRVENSKNAGELPL